MLIETISEVDHVAPSSFLEQMKTKEEVAHCIREIMSVNVYFTTILMGCSLGTVPFQEGLLSQDIELLGELTNGTCYILIV